MPNLKKLTSIFVTLLALGGCAATSNVYQNSGSMVPPDAPTMVLLPPDFEVSIKNAGGDLELDIELTAQARDGYQAAVMELMFEKGVRLIPYGSDSFSDAHLELVRESNTVMDSIELSQSAKSSLGSSRNLSLSESARETLAQFGAQYATFTIFRAVTPSGGRQAVAVIAALGGVAVQTSEAKFRVAVFDLRDGQCIWANFDPDALPDGRWANADEEQWIKNTEHMYQGIPF